MSGCDKELSMKTTTIFGICLALVSSLSLAEEAKSAEKPKDDIPALIKQYPMPTAKMLGDNCSACHGTLGREFNEAMPPLAGMSKSSFVKVMKQYRDNAMPSIVMHDVAYVFTDAEIDAMGDYFAAQAATQWTAPNLGGQQ
jgi:cytochrome c553